MHQPARDRRILVGAFAAAAAAPLVGAVPSASASAAPTSPSASSQALEADAAYSHGGKPVHIEVFTPERHINAGIQGRGWFVDMELDFPGGPDGLRQSGLTDLQLTGPGVHNNVAPLPGSFSTGDDDRTPGLVVLTLTTNSTTPGFSGPGTNLANLFNITGVTNRTPKETELWDTWLVGAPIAGSDVDTTLTVAEVADLNNNGVFDDAPDVVTDLNHDGVIDAKDHRLLGVSSNIVTVPFHINGAAA